jgi:hypothetical protein
MPTPKLYVVLVYEYPRTDLTLINITLIGAYSDRKTAEAARNLNVATKKFQATASSQTGPATNPTYRIQMATGTCFQIWIDEVAVLGANVMERKMDCICLTGLPHACGKEGVKQG